MTVTKKDIELYGKKRAEEMDAERKLAYQYGRNDTAQDKDAALGLPNYNVDVVHDLKQATKAKAEGADRVESQEEINNRIKQKYIDAENARRIQEGGGPLVKDIYKSRRTGAMAYVNETEREWFERTQKEYEGIDYSDGTGFVATATGEGALKPFAATSGIISNTYIKDRNLYENMNDAAQIVSDAADKVSPARKIIRDRAAAWQAYNGVDLQKAKELVDLKTKRAQREVSNRGGFADPSLDARIKKLEDAGVKEQSWFDYAAQSPLDITGQGFSEVGEELGNWALLRAGRVVPGALTGFAAVEKVAPKAARAIELVGQSGLESSLQGAQTYVSTYNEKLAGYKQQGLDDTKADELARTDANYSAALGIISDQFGENILRIGRSGYAVEDILFKTGKGASTTAIKTAAGESLGEGVTALVQTAGQNAYDSDKDLNDITMNELTVGLRDQAQQGMALGGLVGGAIGAVDQVHNTHQNIKIGNAALLQNELDSSKSKATAETNSNTPTATTPLPAFPDVSKIQTKVSPKDAINNHVLMSSKPEDVDLAVTSIISAKQEEFKKQGLDDPAAAAEIERTYRTIQAKIANGEVLSADESRAILDELQTNPTTSSTPLAKSIQESSFAADDDFTTGYIFNKADANKAALERTADPSVGAASNAQQVAAKAYLNKLETGRAEFDAAVTQANQAKESGNIDEFLRLRRALRTKFSQSSVDSLLEKANSVTEIKAPAESSPKPTEDNENALDAKGKSDGVSTDEQPLHKKGKVLNAKNATVAQKYALGKLIRSMPAKQGTLVLAALKAGNVSLVSDTNNDDQRGLVIDSEGKVYINFDRLTDTSAKAIIKEVVGFGTGTTRKSKSTKLKNVENASDEELTDSIIEDINSARDLTAVLRHESRHIKYGRTRKAEAHLKGYVGLVAGDSEAAQAKEMDPTLSKSRVSDIRAHETQAWNEELFTLAQEDPNIKKKAVEAIARDYAQATGEAVSKKHRDKAKRALDLYAEVGGTHRDVMTALLGSTKFNAKGPLNANRLKTSKTPYFGGAELNPYVDLYETSDYEEPEYKEPVVADLPTKEEEFADAFDEDDIVIDAPEPDEKVSEETAYIDNAIVYRQETQAENDYRQIAADLSINFDTFGDPTTGLPIPESRVKKGLLRSLRRAKRGTARIEGNVPHSPRNRSVLELIKERNSTLDNNEADVLSQEGIPDVSRDARLSEIASARTEPAKVLAAIKAQANSVLRMPSKLGKDGKSLLRLYKGAISDWITKFPKSPMTKELVKYSQLLSTARNEHGQDSYEYYRALIDMIAAGKMTITKAGVDPDAVNKYYYPTLLALNVMRDANKIGPNGEGLEEVLDSFHYVSIVPNTLEHSETTYRLPESIAEVKEIATKMATTAANLHEELQEYLKSLVKAVNNKETTIAEAKKAFRDKATSLGLDGIVLPEIIYNKETDEYRVPVGGGNIKAKGDSGSSLIYVKIPSEVLEGKKFASTAIENRKGDIILALPLDTAISLLPKEVQDDITKLPTTNNITSLLSVWTGKGTLSNDNPKLYSADLGVFIKGEALRGDSIGKLTDPDKVNEGQRVPKGTKPKRQRAKNDPLVNAQLSLKAAQGRVSILTKQLSDYLEETKYSSYAVMDAKGKAMVEELEKANTLLTKRELALEAIIPAQQNDTKAEREAELEYEYAYDILIDPYARRSDTVPIADYTEFAEGSIDDYGDEAAYYKDLIEKLGHGEYAVGLEVLENYNSRVENYGQVIPVEDLKADLREYRAYLSTIGTSSAKTRETIKNSMKSPSPLADFYGVDPDTSRKISQAIRGKEVASIASARLKEARQDLYKLKALLQDAFADETDNQESKRAVINSYKAAIAKQEAIINSTNALVNFEQLAIAYAMSDMTLDSIDSVLENVAATQTNPDIHAALAKLRHVAGIKEQWSALNASDIARAVPLVSVLISPNLSIDNDYRKNLKKRVDEVLNSDAIIMVSRFDKLSIKSGQDFMDITGLRREDVEIVYNSSIAAIRKKPSYRPSLAVPLETIIQAKAKNGSINLLLDPNFSEGSQDTKRRMLLAKLRQDSATFLPRIHTRDMSPEMRVIFTRDHILSPYATKAVKTQGNEFFTNTFGPRFVLNGTTLKHITPTGLPEALMPFSPATVNGKLVTMQDVANGRSSVPTYAALDAILTSTLESVKAAIASSATLAISRMKEADILTSKAASETNELSRRAHLEAAGNLRQFSKNQETLTNTMVKSIPVLKSAIKSLHSASRRALDGYLNSMYVTDAKGNFINQPNKGDRFLEAGLIPESLAFMSESKKLDGYTNNEDADPPLAQLTASEKKQKEVTKEASKIGTTGVLQDFDNGTETSQGRLFNARGLNSVTFKSREALQATSSFFQRRYVNKARTNRAIRESSFARISYLAQANEDSRQVTALLKNPDLAGKEGALMQDITDGISVRVGRSLHGVAMSALATKVQAKYGNAGSIVLSKILTMRAAHHANIERAVSSPVFQYGRATPGLINMLDTTFSSYLRTVYASHELAEGATFKKIMNDSLAKAGGIAGLHSFTNKTSLITAEHAINSLLNNPALFPAFAEQHKHTHASGLKIAAAKYLQGMLNGDYTFSNYTAGGEYSTLGTDGSGSLKEKTLLGPDYAPFRAMLGEVKGLQARIVGSMESVSSLTSIIEVLETLDERGLLLRTSDDQSGNSDYTPLDKLFPNSLDMAKSFAGLAIPTYLAPSLKRGFSDEGLALNTVKKAFGYEKMLSTLLNGAVWSSSALANIAVAARYVGMNTPSEAAAFTIRTEKLWWHMLRHQKEVPTDPQTREDYYKMLAGGYFDSWSDLASLSDTFDTLSKSDPDIKAILESKSIEPAARAKLLRAVFKANQGKSKVLSNFNHYFSLMELPAKIYGQMTYIKALEGSKLKLEGRALWARAGDMAMNDSPSAAKIIVAIKNLEKYSITRFFGFFSELLRTITIGPIDNILTLHEAGNKKAIIGYTAGLGASAYVGTTGLMTALAFLLRAFFPPPEDKEKQYAADVANQIAMLSVSKPNGFFVPLGYTDEANGVVRMIDLSFIAAPYGQFTNLAADINRKLKGDDSASAADIIKRNLMVGFLGKIFVNSIINSDGTKVLDDSLASKIQYAGLPGAIRRARKDGHWVANLLGVTTTEINPAQFIHSRAGMAFANAKEMGSLVNEQYSANPYTYWTQDEIYNRYSKQLTAINESPKHALAALEGFAAARGLAPNDPKIIAWLVKGKKDESTLELLEKGPEAISKAAIRSVFEKGAVDSQVYKSMHGKLTANEKSDKDAQGALRNFQEVVESFAPVELNPPVNVSITAVKDGDTFFIMLNGTRREVRALGWDTAEEGTASADGTSGIDWKAKGTEAFLKATQGKTITIQFAKDRKDAFDSEGRLLAYVFADGVDVSAAMAESEMAYVTGKDSTDVPFEHPSIQKDKNEGYAPPKRVSYFRDDKE